MRTTPHARASRSENGIPWMWITIIIVVLGVIFLNSSFSGRTDSSTTGSYLLVEPGSGSEVFIKTSNNSSKQISETEKLYTTDSSLSISSGFAHISSTYLDGYLDKSTELSYKGHTSEGEALEFTRGRLWIESHGNNTLVMKNIEVLVKDGDIVMLEQPNQIFSTLYVLRGNISITAGGISSQIPSGKKIMVSKSDLANPGITLDKLTGAIDDSLKQNPLFILRNGGTLLLSNTGTTASTSTGESMIQNNASGSVIETGSKKYIEITSPIDQSEISKATVDIFGKILSNEVRRVTLNDIDAVVSPVDESFTLKGIQITNDIINIVYKVYSKDSILLERGVLTLYPKNRQGGVDKLTPNNFPINDKDYRVLSPSENPFITTDTSVTVSGVVPKNTVQYILVNNYRLKKFVPFSSSWYYYANMDYDTMKDGINLYEIGFYGSSNQLLSTQLFTVVKEGKRSVSGEMIQ